MMTPSIYLQSTSAHAIITYKNSALKYKKECATRSCATKKAAHNELLAFC